MIISYPLQYTYEELNVTRYKVIRVVFQLLSIKLGNIQSLVDINFYINFWQCDLISTWVLHVLILKNLYLYQWYNVKSTIKSLMFLKPRWCLKISFGRSIWWGSRLWLTFKLPKGFGGESKLLNVLSVLSDLRQYELST